MREARIQRALEGAALLVLFALIGLSALRLLWDIDIFWHVVAGRLLRQEGLEVSRDTFSAIDPDQPWVPLVWGYHVLTSYLDDLGGLQALRLFHAAVQVLAFAIFWWTCRFKLKLGALPSLVLLALLLLLYADRFRARPHVFNLLFEILLLPRLCLGAHGIGRRQVLGVGALFLLWANLHGGGAFVFAVALGAIPGAALVERLARVDGAAQRLRWSLLWYGALVLACVVSPFFVRSIIHTAGMVEGAEEYTYEWHPSWRLFQSGWLAAHYFAGAYPSLLAVALAFPFAKILGAVSSGRAGLAQVLGRYPLHALLAAAAVTYLAHRSLRFIYMEAYATILIIPALREAFAQVKLPARASRVALLAAGLLLAAMSYQSRITGIYRTLPHAWEVVTGSDPLQRDRFPVAQADFLQAQRFHGKIFCQAMWGGYLLYRLWPAVTVLADGRGNYSQEVTRDLRTVGNKANMQDPAHGPGILEIYQRYQPDAIVHHHPTFPEGYAQQAFTLVEEDAIGQVWVRGSTAAFPSGLAPSVP